MGYLARCARPTSSRIFSVPARRPISWPPPWISGSNRTVRAPRMHRLP